MVLQHETYTFAEAHRRLAAFTDLLALHGITIQKGGPLERLAHSVVDLVDQHADPAKQDPMVDSRAWFREVVGMSHLVALVLSVRESPCFTELLPHLQLLNVATSTQNSRSSVTDAASNKLFEMFVAIAAMRRGYTTHLDHPKNATGKNPDVLIELEPGRVFGVACKMMHTAQPATMIGAIEKAVSQLENSPATEGVVAIGLKNIFPHDEFFPILNLATWKSGKAEPMYGAFRSKKEMIFVANQLADRFHAALGEEAEFSELRRIFGASTKPIIPAVAYYVHTATAVRHDGGGAPLTSVSYIRLKTLWASIPNETLKLIEDINENLQIA